MITNPLAPIGTAIQNAVDTVVDSMKDAAEEFGLIDPQEESTIEIPAVNWDDLMKPKTAPVPPHILRKKQKRREANKRARAQRIHNARQSRKAK